MVSFGLLTQNKQGDSQSHSADSKEGRRYVLYDLVNLGVWPSTRADGVGQYPADLKEGRGQSSADLKEGELTSSTTWLTSESDPQPEQTTFPRC